jgi:hypothetical protein
MSDSISHSELYNTIFFHRLRSMSSLEDRIKFILSSFPDREVLTEILGRDKVTVRRWIDKGYIYKNFRAIRELAKALELDISIFVDGITYKGRTTKTSCDLPDDVKMEVILSKNLRDKLQILCSYRPFTPHEIRLYTGISRENRDYYLRTHNYPLNILIEIAHILRVPPSLLLDRDTDKYLIEA